MGKLLRPVVQPLLQPVVVRGLSHSVGAAAATPAFALADAFDTDGVGFLYDPGDAATVFEASADPAEDGDTIFQIQNGNSGNTNHVEQATASLQPLWDEPGSLMTYDGTDDRMLFTWPSGHRTTDMRVFIVTKIATDNDAIIFGTGANTQGFLLFHDGNSNSAFSGMGTPTLWVDNVEIVTPTRGELHTAIVDGNPHIVELRGADFSNSRWGTGQISSYSNDTGFPLDGQVGVYQAITETAASTHAGDIRTLLADRYGVTL